MSVCVYYTDSQKREVFLSGLSSRCGVAHQIRRSDLPAAVIALYKEKLPEILLENPFHVHFVGEKGFDGGGVGRDMFSAFFEEIYRVFFNLLTPIVGPGMDVSTSSIIVTVISHAYIACGLLPTCIAFPSLACCLLGQSVNIIFDFGGDFY